MGNDGGSIPKRIELVKEKKKEVRPDQNALKIATWFFCALSKRALREPIVVCPLGRLYNKDAIIEFLLNKSAYGDGDIICSHISGIKDVKTLNLTINPAFKESSNSTITHFDPGMVSRFICPITMKEMSGKLKFIYLDTCGCVFSEQGLKEVPSNQCLQCAKPYGPDNVVIINPASEEQEKLRTALVEKKVKAKGKKDKKKLKMGEQEEKAKSTLITASTLQTNDKDIKGNKRKLNNNDVPGAGLSKRAAIELKVGGGSSNSITSVNRNIHGNLDSSTTNLKRSKAIQSIYKKQSDTSISESYLVKGTFNRYAA
ncbi:hypothetical protein G9A89_017499 [Geosiphon pyriformis]|nr:hypothetical protein G9A89_017499 [Geosiphon pyriformis]